MDAHCFRRVGEELSLILPAARIEKVYGPLPHVCVFILYTGETKQRLVLNSSKQEPALFFVQEHLHNPATPTSHTMYLRKYCSGKRLGEVRLDWAHRRLAIAIPALAETAHAWLLLDLRSGVSLAKELPTSFTQAVLWPPAEVISQLCIQEPESTLTAPALQPAIWSEWPVLTPALRRTLHYLDAPEGKALLIDLEDASGNILLYTSPNLPPIMSAWPLPTQLLPAAAHESIVAEKYPALHATQQCAEAVLLEQLGKVHTAPELSLGKREEKRLLRLLTKLEQEEKRLHNMLQQRESATAITADLHRYAPDAKLAAISVCAWHGLEQGAEQRILLDPLLTVRENVQKMFHQSDRGARGLKILQQRRRDVSTELQALQRGELLHQKAGTATPRTKGQGATKPQRKQDSAPVVNKLFTQFRSSDGFLLMRGRNAKGNQEILRYASPYDLWFHAEDGPSAHLILRRDHAAVDVPQSTLDEAAILTGLKSWQQNDSKARIMCAYAKDVKPVKGGKPGSVRVQRVWRSFVVTLDASLEERLTTA